MDLEKHSSIISSLLALGHNLSNEMEIRPRNIDSLTRSVQTLEQRWASLKDLLRTRKLEQEDIHLSWRSVEEAMKRASKMITDHERFLTELKRTSGDGLQGIRNEYKSLDNFKRTLEDDEKVIQQVNHNYTEVLRIYPSADNNRMKELNNRWEILNATFQESLKNVRTILRVLIEMMIGMILAEIYVECAWRFSIDTRFTCALVDRSGCPSDQPGTFIRSTE